VVERRDSEIEILKREDLAEGATDAGVLTADIDAPLFIDIAPTTLAANLRVTGSDCRRQHSS
jgi:hypothetical protein